MTRIKLTKEQWIERYGGQEALERDLPKGYDIVPCENCDDTICHGWRIGAAKEQPHAK